MQVAPPGGQIWNQCQVHYMFAKFGTNSGGITWWSTFELFTSEKIIQVINSIPWVRCASGNVFTQACDACDKYDLCALGGKQNLEVMAVPEQVNHILKRELLLTLINKSFCSTDPTFHTQIQFFAHEVRSAIACNAE